MRIEVQRAIDKWVGIPLCALTSLVERLRPARPAAQPPRRILVVLLSEMGSLVLAQPMFAWLRERYPDASLHMLMFARNREMIELLGVMPPEHVIAIDDRSLGGFVRDGWRALRRMHALRPDVVIDCELFARISSLLAYLSGAPVRVGFHNHTQEGLYRGSYINRPVIYNPYRHLTWQLLTLASAIDSTTRPLAKIPVQPRLAAPARLPMPPAELDAIRVRLRIDFPGTGDAPLVLVYAGGGILPVRAWPAEHYVELCARLARAGYAVGLTGLREDTPLARDIVRRCAEPHVVDLTGWTRTVRELIALLHCAALLVTNDGAPGQFAALTATPTIILFGPETPALYGPLAPNVHTMYLGIACSPCLTAYNHRRTPCDGDNQCLKRIGVDEVHAKARELLGPRPADAARTATAGA